MKRTTGVNSAEVTVRLAIRGLEVLLELAAVIMNVPLPVPEEREQLNHELSCVVIQLTFDITLNSPVSPEAESIFNVSGETAREGLSYAPMHGGFHLSCPLMSNNTSGNSFPPIVPEELLRRSKFIFPGSINTGSELR